MKKVAVLLILGIVGILKVYSQQYSPDILGKGFSQRTIQLQEDYEGEVVATIVKYNDSTRVDSNRAMLYIHGFNDYFFQEELARKIYAMNCDFYALDLRKYGRSTLKHQKIFNIRNIEEYYEELDSAINIIKSEGHDSIYIMGHSTGGLTTTLYIHDRDKGKNIKGLILNSPYYEQNQSWLINNIGTPLISCISHCMPDYTYEQGYSTAYTQSIHKKYGKEWDYDFNYKHESSPDVTFSWISAIYKAQNRIKDIKNMPIPTIVMHSDKSTFDPKYNSSYENSDAVLDIEDINKHAKNFGKNTKIVVIKDAKHDIALSNKDVREKYYNEIDNFLKNTK